MHPTFKKYLLPDWYRIFEADADIYNWQFKMSGNDKLPLTDTFCCASCTGMRREMDRGGKRTEISGMSARNVALCYNREVL